MDKKFQTVAVLGLGRSGMASAKALQNAGVRVWAWDDSQASDFSLTDLRTVDWGEVDAFILSPGIPQRHPVVQAAILAGKQPLSDIDILYQIRSDATYIAITGTNGKSTTTALIGHILKQAGKDVQVGGNIGIPALELSVAEIYVLEMSSYQLDISPHFRADIGVLLNITPDHLDHHGSMDKYVAAKQKVARAKTLVASVDDAYCRSICESAAHVSPFSVHKELPGGVWVQEGQLYEGSAHIADLQLLEHLKGEHNWQNIAAAFGALRALGMPADQILEGVISFQGLAHRQQVVGRHKNVLFVNDSKGTNADATVWALEAYKGRPVYLLLGGQQKEGGIELLRPYFPGIAHAFVYGEAAADFAVTLEGHVPYARFETLTQATEAAATVAFAEGHADAVVLLSPACASWDQFRNFEERGEMFCQWVKGLTG